MTVNNAQDNSGAFTLEQQPQGNGIVALQWSTASGNCLSAGLIQALQANFEELAEDASIKVVILRGNGDDFAHGDRAVINAMVEQQLLPRLMQQPFVTVAAMTGNATGAGWLLASACDFMIAATQSEYGFGTDHNGLVVSRSELNWFAERFGTGKSRDLLQRQGRVYGKYLQENGWQFSIVGRSQVEASAQTLAAVLAEKSRESLALLKQHLNRFLLQQAQSLTVVNTNEASAWSAPRVIRHKPAHLSLSAESVGTGHYLLLTLTNADTGFDALLADFAKAADALGKQPGVFAALVVDCPFEGGLPGSQAATKEQLETLQQWLQALPVPGWIRLQQGAAGKGWLTALMFDDVIHERNSHYSAAGLLGDPDCQSLAAFWLAHQASEQNARQWLVSGDSLGGLQLQQRASLLACSVDKQPDALLGLVQRQLTKGPDAVVEHTGWQRQALADALAQVPQNTESFEATEPAALCIDEPQSVALASSVVTATAYPQGILLVEMHDRDAKNMFTEAFVAGVTEAFEYVAATPAIKAVVLTGYDKYFASGGTKEGLLSIQEGRVKFTDTKVYQQALSCEVPVVAAVQGHAVGAGLSLALFADFSLISSESKYLSPYMGYGFTPGAGATLIVPTRWGYDLGREGLMTAEAFGGREMQGRGVLLPVYKRADLLPAAMVLAEQLAAYPRAALVSLKQQLDQTLKARLEDNYAREVAMHEQTFVGHDGTLQQIETSFDSMNAAASQSGTGAAIVAEAPAKPATSVAQLSESEQLALVTETLRDLLASELQLDEDEVEDDAQFVDLGLDSINGVSLIRKINQCYNTNIEATMVYSYPNLTKLARFVREEALASGGLNGGLDAGMDDGLGGVDSALNPPAATQHVPAEAVVGSSSVAASLSQTQTQTQTQTQPLALADVTEFLRQLLANELQLDEDEVEDDAQFVDLGLDSINGVSLIRKINQRYDTAIEATMVYSYPNLTKLARFVREEAEAVGPVNGGDVLPQATTALPVAASETAQETTSKAALNQPDVTVAASSPVVARPLADITETLRQLVAHELQLEDGEVEDDAQFVDLGLDSINGVSLIRKINQQFGIHIEATSVYSYPNLTRLARFVSEESRASGVAPMASAEVASPFSQPPVSESVSQNPTDVMDTLRTLVADELQLDEHEVEDDAQFVDLGLDSINGVSLIRKINQTFGTHIEATEVYSHPNLRKLAAHVVQLSAVASPVQVQQPVSESAAVISEPAPQSTTQSTTQTVLEQTAVNPLLSEPVIQQVDVPELVSIRKRRPLAVEQNFNDTDPIAIIGMAGQFPQANNLDEYWQNLVEGRNCITEMTNERWDVSEWYQEGAPAEGKTNSKWMGLLEEFDCFDPLFFNISPLEARYMDPQQRLFLQTAWHGIEHAGYTGEQLSGSRCGVFVGTAAGDYAQLSEKVRLSSYGFSGNASAILAARIAYLMNLQGPCVSIDTACSSSLVAIAQAADSLNNGTSDLALAGGVYFGATPAMQIMCSQAGMLSTDGRCYTFDDRANGFVPGEAVGVVVLKRLADAERDGDIVHAVLQGWGVNQDGKTNGITAPNPESQALLEQTVYDRFRINPEHIQLVEAHGTGTNLGDPIEMQGLRQAFRKYTNKTGYCAVGSVKSNIGHCLLAAGVSAVIKMVLSLKHKTLPPSINYENLNGHIRLDNTPFYINQRLQPWSLQNGADRRMGVVSSFGFSGTNAHLVVAEHQPVVRPSVAAEAVTQGGKQLLPLSAKTPEALIRKAADLAAYLRRQRGRINLTDLAWSLQTTREAMEERLVVLADSPDALESRLQQLVDAAANTDWKSVKVGDCFIDGVRGNKQGLSVITQDDDIRHTIIDKSLESGDLKKLAKLWSKGLDLDWNKFYRGGKPARVELPVYPFAKERYWIDAQDLNTSPSEAERNGYLHPLVHRNTSTLFEQRYTTQLSGSESVCQSLSRGTGKIALLPAAAMLEMANAALLASVDLQGPVATQLSDLQWGAPALLTGQALHLIMLPTADDAPEAEFELRSDDVESGELLLQGMAEIVEASLGVMNLAQLQARCPQVVDAEVALAGQAGSESVITAIRSGDHELFAELALPASSASDHTYQLHPARLDAVFQVAALLMDDSSVRWTADQLDTLLALQPLADARYVWLRRSQVSGQAIDADLCTADGQICLQLQGLTLKPMSDLTEVQEATAQTLLFDEVWQDDDSAPVATAADARVATLASLDELDTVLQQQPDELIVTAAFGQGEAGIQTIYTLLSRLHEIATRKDSGHGTPDVSGTTSIRKLVLVGQLQGASADSCWDSSWIGFERSLKHPMPELAISVVLLDQLTDRDAFIEDCRQRQGHFRIHNNQRQRLQLQALEQPETASVMPAVKQGGCYLITGGAGALGQKFAHFLARQFNASLVLLGRRPQDNALQQQLASLTAAGARAVQYHSVDMTDADALVTLAQRYQVNGIFHAAGVESFVPFHEKTPAELASVLHPKALGAQHLDSAFGTQSSLDFVCYFSSSSAILGDFGCADYAIANRFLMAYGEWREQQLQLNGQTRVISWPLWDREAGQQGGMGFANEDQTRMYLKTSGQQALEKSDGLAIWQQLLAGQRRHTLVMKGNRGQVSGFLERLYSTTSDVSVPSRAQRQPMSANTASASQAAVVDTAVTASVSASSVSGSAGKSSGDISAQVLADLKRLVSESLQIGVERLDVQTNLADFGFDSINLATFAKTLTSHFGVEVTPALFFNCASIEQLQQFYLDEHLAHLQTLYQASETTVSASPTAATIPVSTGQTGGQSLRRPRAAATGGRSASRGKGRRGRQQDDTIAIVGMSGRFPGADSVDEFWSLLENGESGLAEIPADRWNWRDYFFGEGNPANVIKTNKGGFIRNIDKFDPLFFEISPIEAEEMDPSERLLLMESWRAIEDARIDPTSLRGSNTGVFVGMEESQYGIVTGAQGVTTTGVSMITSRLSYFLDFHGPTIATNTACSSGLVAFHQAWMSVRNGECDAALVASVGLSLSPASWVTMSESGMISPDGECFAFAKQANGIGIGEAATVFMIKPLAAALEDGNNIYATIKGSGINFDGKTNGVTAPNGKAQARLIEKVMRDNDIRMSDVSHIVAHGTGTNLGDPVEINALSDVFGKLADGSENREIGCAITSCKTNIGHTLAASGLVSLAGLMKGLQHHRIPANIHCEEENDYINWKDSHFYINKTTRDWVTADGQPRIGAVSSFGRSGTNAHLVVEEFVDQRQGYRHQGEPVLITLSAKADEQLLQRVADLNDWLQQQPSVDLAELAFSLQSTREAMEERLALVVSSVSELQQQLTAIVGGELPAAVSRASVNKHRDAITEINNDPAMQQTIASWLADAQLDKLANLWTQGLALPWAQLYSAGLPRRISLPTYPFAEDRYWLEQASVATATPVARPGPVSAQKNTQQDPLRSLEDIVNGIDDGHMDEEQALKLLDALR